MGPTKTAARIVDQAMGSGVLKLTSAFITVIVPVFLNAETAAETDIAGSLTAAAASAVVLIQIDLVAIIMIVFPKITIHVVVVQAPERVRERAPVQVQEQVQELELARVQALVQVRALALALGRGPALEQVPAPVLVQELELARVQALVQVREQEQEPARVQALVLAQEQVGHGLQGHLHRQVQALAQVHLCRLVQGLEVQAQELEPVREQERVQVLVQDVVSLKIAGEMCAIRNILRKSAC